MDAIERFCKEMEYNTEPKIDILAQGKTYDYYFYIISYGTHPCCYIAIPEGKPFYQDDKCFDLIVHGGITYARDKLHNLITKKDNMWVVGWDYMHSGDYNGIFEKDCPDLLKGTHKWTTKELLAEVIDAIKQIKEKEGK